ncbi:MAG: TetR/AcrR family transcriptional regulator [Actinobacteria bacterium]|nr:TetR/AcrR family transcriptional regulator [Actinomycetota bacterium]
MTLELPAPSSARKRDTTRHALLEAALNVFAAKGYHDAAVGEIVERAGRAKGTAYFHFPNKAAIFRALLRELAGMLMAKVEREIAPQASAVRKLDAALLAVIEIFTEHRKLARIMLVEVAGAGRAFDEDLMFVRQQFACVIRENLDASVAEGTIPPCDTDLIAMAWFGAINEVVVSWLYARDHDSLHTRFPTLRHTLLRSVGIDPITLAPHGLAARA